MDVEIHNCIKVWSAATVSQCYCYFAASRIPSGIPRVISILPVIYLLTTLPLTLHSVHLGLPTAFFLVWMANFKLLLFSFNHGPLPSPLSLSHFIAIALLPIKTKTDPSHKNTSTSTTSAKQRSESQNQGRITKYTIFLIKLAVFVTVITLYNYRPYLHPNFIMVLYCCHLYLGVESFLALTAIPIKAILGLEVARQFNEPYLATSLQDFWGRRWNLMVSDLLRQSIYEPIRAICTPIIGRQWSFVPANLTAFLISGLMHELVFYYLSRASPSWKMTWFFVLQGVCVTCEVYVKKWVAGRWQLHRAVSGPLTVVFVGVTGSWLFFPQLVRDGLDSNVIEEIYDFVRFVRDSFVALPNLINSGI